MWADICKVDLALWKKEDMSNGSDTCVHVVYNLGVLQRKEFMNICVLSDTFIEFY